MKLITNFTEANQYLAGFYANEPARYTLDNLQRLMAYLGNPQDSFKVVHVAGTSGKTSTAYYAAALLRAAGQKTGLTVSPHVDEINERVQLNGRPLAEIEFCRALTGFAELIAGSPIQPSWFEAVIAFAYWYFAQQKVDYAVVEVGLGGLKDGTNVITRPDKLCLITDIGLDHTRVLGSTLAAITGQKIGIVRPHNHVCMYEQAPEIMAVVRRWCARQQASLQLMGESDKSIEQGTTASDLPAYQRRNWRLAYRAYAYLQTRDGLPRLADQVLRQTQAVPVPARMDTRQLAGKTLIMDGAHNVQKMTAFIKSFEQSYPGVRPAILLGLKQGKEYEELVPLLVPLAGRIITTTFDARQDVPALAVDAAVLARAFRRGGAGLVESITDQRAAFRALLGSPENVCILTGSFYLISQIRQSEGLAVGVT